MQTIEELVIKLAMKGSATPIKDAAAAVRHLKKENRDLDLVQRTLHKAQKQRAMEAKRGEQAASKAVRDRIRVEKAAEREKALIARNTARAKREAAREETVQHRARMRQLREESAVMRKQAISAKARGAASALGQGVGALAMGARAGPIGLAVGATVGVATMGHKVVTGLAEDSQRIKGVFDNLTISIDGARRATGGLVDDYTLARTANQLVSFGVVKNSADFANLTRDAQRLGKKLGISTVSAMDSLSAALGRQSKLMLDNLGVILNVEQAHQRYADSLGVTVNQLTDAQKAEAFRVIAMREISKAAADVTVDMDSASAAVIRFNNSIDNLKTRALGGTPGSKTMRQALSDMHNEGYLKRGQNAHLTQPEIAKELERRGVHYSDIYEKGVFSSRGSIRSGYLDRQIDKAADEHDARAASVQSERAIQSLRTDQRPEMIMARQERAEIESMVRVLGDGPEVKWTEEYQNSLQEIGMLKAEELRLEGKLNEARKLAAKTQQDRESAQIKIDDRADKMANNRVKTRRAAAQKESELKKANRRGLFNDEEVQGYLSDAEAYANRSYIEANDEVKAAAKERFAAELTRYGNTKGAGKRAYSAYTREVNSAAGIQAPDAKQDTVMSYLLGDSNHPDVPLSDVTRGAEPQVLISTINNNFTITVANDIQGAGDPKLAGASVVQAFKEMFATEVQTASKHVKTAWAR